MEKKMEIKVGNKYAAAVGHAQARMMEILIKEQSLKQTKRIMQEQTLQPTIIPATNEQFKKSSCKK